MLPGGGAPLQLPPRPCLPQCSPRVLQSPVIPAAAARPLSVSESVEASSPGPTQAFSKETVQEALPQILAPAHAAPPACLSCFPHFAGQRMVRTLSTRSAPLGNFQEHDSGHDCGTTLHRHPRAAGPQEPVLLLGNPLSAPDNHPCRWAPVPGPPPRIHSTHPPVPVASAPRWVPRPSTWCLKPHTALRTRVGEVGGSHAECSSHHRK